MASHMFPQPPLSGIPRQLLKNGAAFVNGSYSSGNAWSVKVDRQSILRAAQLQARGIINTGATPATPTARVRNGPQFLGSTLRVTVNGKDEFNGHPDLLLFREQWRRGKLSPLQRTQLTTTGLAGTNAALSFNFQLPYTFAPANHDPEVTGLLHASKCGDIEIAGTWGTVSDMMITPGTDTVTSANLSLTKDFTNWRPGQLTPQQIKMGWGHFVMRQVGDVATSTGTFSKDIPGGRAYAGFYLRAQSGSTADSSDTCIASLTGEFRLKRGSDFIIQKRLQELINDTAQGLPDLDPSTGNTAWDRTGLIAVDPLKGFEPGERAIITRAMVSSGLQPLTIEVDVVGATGGRVDILTEEYRDPVTSMGERYGLAA